MPVLQGFVWELTLEKSGNSHRCGRGRRGRDKNYLQCSGWKIRLIEGIFKGVLDLLRI